MASNACTNDRIVEVHRRHRSKHLSEVGVSPFVGILPTGRPVRSTLQQAGPIPSTITWLSQISCRMPDLPMISTISVCAVNGETTSSIDHRYLGSRPHCAAADQSGGLLGYALAFSRSAGGGRGTDNEGVHR